MISGPAPGGFTLRLLPALGALAGALLLHRWLPLPAHDPLRTTLAILPPTVVGLWELGRWARRRGGRRTPPAVAAAEAAALGALVLVALARPALALPGSAQVLAGGFALLLAHRVGRLVPALRPALGHRLPPRPPAPFFLLPLLVYLAVLPWSVGQRPPDGDEPYFLLLTHSLATDGDVDLADEYADGVGLELVGRELEPQPGDPEGAAGERWSRHGALLPLALVPGYLAAGKWGALATMAAFTAALAWAILGLLAALFPARPGAALLAWATAAFAPPLLLYSHQFWTEVPAALLVCLGLQRVVRLGRGEGITPAGWAALAAPLLLLPILKLRFLLLAGGLALVLLRRAGDARHRLAGLLLAAGGGAALMVRNQIVFGNPLKYRPMATVALHRYAPADYLEGLAGLFFDCAFGLFAAAPIWLLLWPGVLLLARRRRGLLLDLGLLAGPLLLFVAPRMEWYGGWSPPFRYGLALLPAMVLPLVPLAEGRRRGGARLLIALLGGLTLALTVLFLAVPGWTYNLADGRNHLLDLLGARLGADVARLFPSFVRPRPASWLWPLAALAGSALLWWWPRRRPRATAAWAAGLLLAAAALVPWAATRLPTRVAELEDPWIAKDGGRLFPDRWVVARPRFRGSWSLRQGERARIPVVAGGERVDLVVDAMPGLHNRGPVELELRAGGRVLGRHRVGAGERWHELVLEDVDWRRGEALEVVLPRPPGRPAGVLRIDRVRFDWR